ncbi:MAG: metallophosphoesterase [Bdellovibrionota bacterium]
MIIKFFIALIFALCFMILGHYYIYHRIFEPFIGANNAFWMSGFLLLCGMFFLGFFVIRILPQILKKIIEPIMFTWMGSLFIFLILCVLSFPIQMYFSYFGYSQKILSASLTVFGFCVIGYSIFQAFRKPAIISTFVPMPNTIPNEIENLVAVVLSDIHVSGLIGRRKMQRLVDMVNKLNPDVIFITGDLMDGSLKQLKKEIEPLKDLKAKEKIIYITGNHEYYSGPLVWKNHFKNYFNWLVLSNSSEILTFKGVTLNILGIEDKHWLNYEKIPRHQDKRINKSIDHLHESREKIDNVPPIENCVNILLAHQPKDARYLKPYPWINLQISGHTHGGQIWPIKYLVKKDQKYNVGLYKIQNNQYIYVNQGTGFWGPPMRLGTRCEITLMRFKKDCARVSP